MLHLNKYNLGGGLISLGYCAKGVLFVEDKNSVIYLYSGENWNNSESKSGDINLLDGEIIIKKSSLIEPEIHKKIKRNSNGRKRLVEKIIPTEINVYELVQDGSVIIDKKSKNDFIKGDVQLLYLAKKVIYEIFHEYQISGKIPDKVFFIQ